jgi:predicted amidohydrolase
MRIALFQGPEQSADVARNLERLATVAHAAAERKARLLILPEMFLTGYNIGKDTTHRLAEPIDGPTAQRAAAIARKTGLALLYGYPERAGDAVYNAAQLIDRDGRRLANHRKSHLFGHIDRSAFAAGSGEPTLAELDGMRLGILICYDVEFPENVRLLALAGADLVAAPTALMQPYEFIPRSLVPSRAYENQVFLAYANRCGREDELVYYGLSCIVGPDGADLARAGMGEQLIVADLEPDLLTASRRLNTYLHDRRPELYRTLAETPTGSK